MKTRIALLALIVTVSASMFAARATLAAIEDLGTLLIMISLPKPAAQAGASAPDATAAAAFEKLKSLAGEWEADSNMGKIHARYELVSNGHVLLEHTAVAGMHQDMVTTYYLDGDTLALTHYCDLGNQPRMRARRINPERGEIQFDFAGAANLASPQETHMHAAAIRLVDAGHFTSDWTLFENAKPKLTVSAHYVRVK